MMQEARSFENDLWEVACCPSGVHPLGWGPGVDRRVLMLWVGNNSPDCQLHSHGTPTPDPRRVWQALPWSHTVPCAGKGATGPTQSHSFSDEKSKPWCGPFPAPVGFRSTSQEARGQTLFISRTKRFPHPRKHLEKKQPVVPSQHQALEGVRLSNESEDREGREKGEGHEQKSR